MRPEQKLLEIYRLAIRDLQTIRFLLDEAHEGTAAASGFIALQRIIGVIEEKEA